LDTYDEKKISILKKKNKYLFFICVVWMSTLDIFVDMYFLS